VRPLASAPQQLPPSLPLSLTVVRLFVPGWCNSRSLPGWISSHADGYGYTCSEDAGPNTASLSNPLSPFCVIEQVPFRGVPCSDAAGGEMAYVSLQKLLVENRTTTGRLWENSTQSAWFNWVEEEVDPKGGGKRSMRLHQMWYDDPVSCALKYRAAAALGIGGVGPYEFSDLDYGPNATTEARQQTAAMWATLAEFKHMQ
jgi:hypothetical protein